MPRSFVRSLVVLLSLAAASPSVRAQPASAVDTVVVAGPAVVIYGNVRMDRLRFVDRVPELTVRFTSGADTTARAVTVGLPPELRADTTYRDVRVYFELVAGLEVLDAALREALGAAARPDTTRTPPPDGSGRR